MKPSDFAMTLEEIGATEGVGGERVRQVEARALRKLREPRRARHLADFCDGPGATPQWFAAGSLDNDGRRWTRPKPRQP